MKSISKKIVHELIKKKLTLSTVESCTGGLLSSSIISVAGSSKVFDLGLVTYSNTTKVKTLKISKKIIKKYGAVSKQVCIKMLLGLNKISKTNISVCTTGIAGPSGGSKQKPVGLIYIGVKKGNKFIIKKYLLKNKGRAFIQKTTVNKSLKLILSLIK